MRSPVNHKGPARTKRLPWSSGQEKSVVCTPHLSVSCTSVAIELTGRCTALLSISSGLFFPVFFTAIVWLYGRVRYESSSGTTHTQQPNGSSSVVG